MFAKFNSNRNWFTNILAKNTGYISCKVILANIYNTLSPSVLSADQNWDQNFAKNWFLIVLM